ncbi:MAG TPA: cytochrome c3 family protein, partial [Thermoanaerobaculia bacterium]|nr:cytochrome c3 family protein [Thermoanaerobaculia bacterium]
KAPDEILIDAAKDKRAGTLFPHAKHVEMVDSCVTCHHTSEGLTASSGQKVETCTSCHLDPKAGVPGMREMSLTKNPFHKMCIDCHKAETKGPTKCDDCHPKG